MDFELTSNVNDDGIIIGSTINAGASVGGSFELNQPIVSSNITGGIKGDKGDKGDAGEKGEKGDQGIQGDIGVGTLINESYAAQANLPNSTVPVLTGVVDGTNTGFTVPQALYAVGTLEVYLNGVLQAPGESISETDPVVGLFSFTTAPVAGDQIYVTYQKRVTNENDLAYLGHTHAISDTTGLQAALDGKQATGDYATNTDLTSGLAGKAATTHTHDDRYYTETETNTLLSGKQATGDYATNTALTDGLATKAATAHTHTIANVTNLQTTLDGKQPTLVSGTNIKTINGSSVLGAGDIVVSGGGGTGDIAGPATSTDNAIARFDGTTGKVVQNSIATLSDTGDLFIGDTYISSTYIGVDTIQGYTEMNAPGIVTDNLYSLNGGAGGLPISVPDGLKLNTLAEYSLNTGVTIDGVLLKDSQVKVQAIPGTGAGQLTMSVNGDTDSNSGDITTTGAFSFTAEGGGVNLMSNTGSVYTYSQQDFIIDAPAMDVNVIKERTAAAGVTIDGVLVKDGLVDGVDVSTLPGTIAAKQDTLVSGTNIKTINGTPVLGSGDIVISGGGGGTGDVVGPASSTDNAIARFDGTTGKIVQSSGVTVNDDSSITLSDTNGFISTIGASGNYTSNVAIGISSPSYVNISGVLNANDGLIASSISERTADAGVTIDGVLVKDGLVDGVDVSALPADIAGKANATHTHTGADITGTGKSATTYLRGDNTWVTPTNTTYSEITTAEIDAGTATTLRTMSGRRSQYIVDKATTTVGTGIPNVTATTAVNTNTINERTAAAGVTIDGVLVKDGAVSAAVLTNYIAEKDAGSGITIANFIASTAGASFTGINTDTVTEKTANAGVTVDGVLIKDGLVDGVDVSELPGRNSFVAKETPAGVKNGVNTTFTTAQPYIAGTLQVFVNGLAQSSLTTETTPATGTFTIDAPSSTDDISVAYQFAASSSGNADTVDGYHANATPTANQIPVLDSNGRLPDNANTQKHYIEIRLSSSHTVTSTDALIPFNSTSFSLGDKLTRSGSTILIGSGVSTVRVSYSLMAESANTATYLYTRINVVGTDVSQAIDASGSTGAFKSTSESKIINVLAGDTIGLRAATGAGTALLPSARPQTLLVEVIK